MGFNLDNKCDILLFVKTFDNVPVFIDFFCIRSFVYASSRICKKNKKEQTDSKKAGTEKSSKTVRHG